jgi:CRP-like cAMP-binding protein
VRENPTQALAIIGHLMHERAELLDKLHAMASQNVEQRLINALERLTADRSFMTSDGKLRLDIKHHRLLCEMVGATRESIALALGRLAGMGLATRRGAAFLIAPRDLANHITPSASDGETALPVMQEMTH